MITEVPDKSDFERSGIGFLNLAWEHAVELLMVHKDFDISAMDSDGSTNSEYWEAAQSELATSAALAQQGIEFLLKGHIAGVSVYLLISGDPRDWPKGSDKNDVAFAEFRTIDAQDLIRAHDSVCSTRLTDEFKTSFERLRRLRNSIFHTVDRRVKFRAEDILKTILFACETLIGHRKWLSLRREHLRRSPMAIPGGGDGTDISMIQELKVVIDNLPPSDVEHFTGFKPRQRRYLCGPCERQCRGYGTVADCAQLVPNTPSSTVLHCFGCDQDSEVIRRPCKHDDCKSNVIEALDEVCCICFD